MFIYTINEDWIYNKYFLLLKLNIQNFDILCNVKLLKVCLNYKITISKELEV